MFGLVGPEQTGISEHVHGPLAAGVQCHVVPACPQLLRLRLRRWDSEALELTEHATGIRDTQGT